MTQSERVEYMGRILEEASAMIDALSSMLDRYDALVPAIDELEAYYTGPQWIRDYEDDCAGAIPAEINRSVLSQDAVYDLLELRDVLHARMTRITAQRSAAC